MSGFFIDSMHKIGYNYTKEMRGDDDVARR